jgi:hypothetical protein
MSKYAPKQIKQAAQIALKARDLGDTRWLELIMTMCVRTGLDPRQVERNIESLAGAA